ncbi:uncharacterized protein MEPE_03204 [Melanopsichium pennsylvanicum]|uniref:Thioredoxin domain-containing protein n=2 Tax=Melanopsichium pennsylvanicum TaxID=63383 RepID=A0AAJ5C595_9BASI|nr:conserved hypothetical protein [Melanopsichium pennsylvanicum 4]SNX84495.1 uncharacterized protein MEPE_03204 [Melanopsichium pennsylvanicum]
MTITTSTEIPSRQGTLPQYFIFFSSGNPPWCPDCVDAQAAVGNVFGGTNVDGHIVLVGEKSEWKTTDNKFRKQYGIKCIPTITKVVDGKEVARLEDSECKNADIVAAFVKA